MTARKPPSRHKKTGRPSDYKPSFCKIAANLCAHGATDEEVARELKTHPSTLYRWAAVHPEFREALKAGKEIADDRVERSLYHRAVGYTFKSLKIFNEKGVPLVVPFDEHVPPDTGAIQFWLKNRRGAQWRDKQDIEHSGEIKTASPEAIAEFHDVVLKLVEKTKAAGDQGS